MISSNKIFSIHAISLGCPKNRVDTEKFLGQLGERFILTNEIIKSDIVFINTCAFIEPSVKESLREIFDIVDLIKHRKNKPLIVVSGCIIGRYGYKVLKNEIPEVDIWLKGNDVEEWVKILFAYLGVNGQNALLRLHPLKKSYSWLKIAEGCNNKCSFCTIPKIKGNYISTPFEPILEEIIFLLDNGVKEIDVVAQDVTAWGKDNSTDVCRLIERIVKLDKLQWLRLLYLYPKGITDHFLSMFNEVGAPLLPYFDIPFQHSEQNILKKMGRPFQISPYEIIEKIHSKVNNAALRTSLIVGFPGETDKDFYKLCDFIKNSRFHNLGVFKYYAEEGTRASLFDNQIPEKIKEERVQEIHKIQSVISQSILQSYVGSCMDVLVDDEDFDEWPGLYKGRVWFQAPEIDGVTYISGPNVSLGNIVQGVIEDSKVYDLVAIN